jgi:DNA-binding NarL/FixJ family response regulator
LQKSNNQRFYRQPAPKTTREDKEEDPIPAMMKPSIHDLTPAELAVLRLISQGYGDNEIAEDACLVVGTVKGYVSRMLSRWGLKNRTQLAIVAYQLGLVNPYDLDV